MTDKELVAQARELFDGILQDIAYDSFSDKYALERVGVKALIGLRLMSGLDTDGKRLEK